MKDQGKASQLRTKVCLVTMGLAALRSTKQDSLQREAQL
jgi:hypothetical protein